MSKLINFKFSNVYSYYNEAELDLRADTANKYQLFLTTMKLDYPDDVNVLRVATILGKTESGKTNLFLALRELRNIIRGVWLDKMEDSQFNMSQPPKTNDQKYIVEFEEKNIHYRYTLVRQGWSIKYEKFEKLYQNETIFSVFERNENWTYRVNNESKTHDELKMLRCCYSFVEQCLDGKVADKEKIIDDVQNLYSFFDKGLFFADEGSKKADEIWEQFIANKNEYLESITRILQDNGYENLISIDYIQPVFERSRFVETVFSNIDEKYYRNTRDVSKHLESIIIQLIILETLKNQNLVLMYDDFDKDIDSSFAKKLIDNLNDSDIKMQTIISIKNESIINRLRPDQINLIEKDHFGISSITNLNWFENIQNKYGHYTENYNAGFYDIVDHNIKNEWRKEK